MVEKYTTNGCFKEFELQDTRFIPYIGFHLDVSMEVNFPFVVGNDYFFSTVETHSLSFHHINIGIALAFGDVIQTKHHVLRRKGDGCTILWIEDIV